MRALVIALVGFGAVAATPASAQMYPPDVPVCLKVFGRANYTECRYASIAQCQLSASGRSAQCIENPYFVGGQQRPRGARGAIDLPIEGVAEAKRPYASSMI